MRVVVNGQEYPDGVGNNKKEAKRKAAENALKALLNEPVDPVRNFFFFLSLILLLLLFSFIVAILIGWQYSRSFYIGSSAKYRSKQLCRLA